jgi:undecaprenyl-diphosphatase
MQALDHRIVAWMSGLDLPLVTPLMKLASIVGSDGLVFVGIALWIALARRRAAVAVATIFAVIGSQIISNLLKNAFDRRRPSVAYSDVHPLVAVPANASMPSGHAWIAFAAATVLCVAVPRRRAWFLALAGLIALSRVYLGVHYPSDVVAGAAGGVVTGLLVLLGARLVHAQVRADDHGDGRDQRQVDPERGTDGDAEGLGEAAVERSARLGHDPEQHQQDR